MECPGFSNSYAVAIKEGYMKYQFHEYDLKPATYEVKLYTIGDSKFDPQEITTTFTVISLSLILGLAILIVSFMEIKLLLMLMQIKDSTAQLILS